MASVAVIGDACVDRFIYGNALRLAPDIPVPILEATDIVESPGMAANVAAGLVALGLNGVETFFPSNWEKSTKARYVEKKSNHTFLRVDSGGAIEQFDYLDFPVEDYETVVVSDYAKGFLDPDVIANLTSRHPNVYLDTKAPIDQWAEGVKFLKINELEFTTSRQEISPELLSRTIVTLGPRGAQYRGKVIPARPIEVRDLSGAGDSFLAGLVYSQVQGMNILDSIDFANRVAEVAVSRRGVVSVTQEMLARHQHAEGGPSGA